MIKAVLFDLDNTLIDFMKMKKSCIKAATTAMIDSGLKMSEEEIEKKLFQLYEKYGIEYEKIFQKFLKTINGKVDYKILANGIVAYRKVRTGYLEPYPGAENTLKTLKQKGLKLGIISDAPKIQAWIRLASMKIDKYFDIVICTGKNKKPDSLPFKKALKQLRIRPEEALMVGDWPERDILGARKVGMKTCFAKYGYIGTYTKTDADFEIGKIEDLVKTCGL